MNKNMKYIPLRVHSVFSKGNGAVDAKELAGFLKERKISCLAVSDQFGMVSWESFRKEAFVRNMKPLLGMEVKIQRFGSIVLFPLTVRGYASLISSYNNKVFSRMEEVIVIFIPARGTLQRVPAFINSIKKQVVPEDFYLGLEWDTKRSMIKLAKRFKIPLVWAQPLKWVGNPKKYAVVSSIFNHRPILEMLNGGADCNSSIHGPISYGAIQKRWEDIGKEAMKNTFDISSRVEFDFSNISAGSDIKELNNRKGDVLERIIKREVRRGNLTLGEMKRAFIELSIIKGSGFSSYFLIAAEIASYCRKNKIYFNLRGSGVSSFILFLLGLSRVNPLKYNLLFERFVNSLRDDLPDIDIDIDSSRRSQVLDWVFKKYRGRVAFVSTHKFFRARSALYEVARSYGFDSKEAHNMSKELPMFAYPSELAGRGKGRMSEMYNKASLLNGVYKELSLHLGGVVFSINETKRSFPVEKSPHGFYQVVWDKDTIERLGIFKLDILGVRGFDVISPVAMENVVDFGDSKVWKNICNANTIGCFQLESPLARESLQKVKPKNLGELAISIAIIRPGPARSGMKKSYIEKKPPFHPVLNKMFPHTRGTLIFEEQISVLLHFITGWSLELSEKIRRELKKRRGEKYKNEFLEKGKKNSWKDSELERFWKMAVDFSIYAFSHSHSVSYSYSAYISAWFKTKYPVNFFCRLFNSGGGYYPLPSYIEEAKRWKIRIFAPDINFSTIGFSMEDGSIRTGLIFVKGIGEKLSSKIVGQRGSGYVSFEDFIARTKPGERELSALIAASAFRSVGHNGFPEKKQEKNWKHYLGFVPE